MYGLIRRDQCFAQVRPELRPELRSGRPRPQGWKHFPIKAGVNFGVNFTESARLQTRTLPGLGEKHFADGFVTAADQKIR